MNNKSKLLQDERKKSFYPIITAFIMLLGVFILMFDLLQDVYKPYRAGEYTYVSLSSKSDEQTASIESELAKLNKEIKANNNLGYNLVLRASILERQDNLKAALGDLNQAILLQTDNQKALISRARIHRILGNYEASMTDLNKILAINPENSSGLFNLAILLYKQDKFEEALASLNRNIELNPNINILYFNRALVLVELNQTRQALNDFSKFIDNASDDESDQQLVDIAKQQIERLLKQTDKIKLE